MDFFVGTFVGLIDNYLIAPIGRQINYLRRSSVNVNDKRTAVRNLMVRRDDNQSTLKNSGDVETKEAINWFDDVEAIKKEADAIEVEYNQGGWCLNCYSRYRSSKRSIDLKRKAEGCFNEQFVLAKQPSPKPVKEIECEPIENQPSTLGMLEKILGCIGDPKFRIIGVYGMGGVGKTTLAKQVNNHFFNNSCFETVIMVTVSATPNIPSIQTTIGKRLGLDLSNTTKDDAREKLYDALKRKKFLLILDDVWSILELKDVGIPHPRRNDKRSSKILLTSRSQDACTDMDAETTIKVQPLSSDESWSLFIKKAGQHVTTNDHIKCSAQKIVGKCKGLPLAIVTVARAMANRRGVGVWENAAREMEQSAIDLRGMKDEVLVPLKFSFDRLDDDKLKSLFLYCACFPEDHNIQRDDVLDYCVGEGLVDTLGSLINARNKGEAVIESLKIACMLEDGEHEGSVRMHDMMRELALWITSSKLDGSPKFLIRTHESYKEAPHASEWVDSTRISLMNKIKELPELGERCRNLTTLLLKVSGILIVPPTNFLQHMDHLSILDLSYSNKLEYLPDSLSCLENLRVLRLRRCCNLKALPALGRLRQLQVLDLNWCDNLNQQIFGSGCVGIVSNLRHLDVDFSKVSIPTGVISRLVKVEELTLEHAYKIKWNVKAENEIINEERRGGLSSSDGEVQDDQQPSSSSSSINQSIIDVKELSKLTRLTTLDIRFEDIIISDWFKPLAKKIRSLSLIKCRVTKQDAIVQALNESQFLNDLEIDRCTGLTCVPTLIKRLLNIRECKDLEKLLDGAEAYQDSFQRLISLAMSCLPNLERICVGRAPLNCFAQLSYLTIVDCNRLKMVFSKEMPRHFNNLREMIIHDCNEVEVIIEAKEEEDERGFVMEGSNNGSRVLISPFPKLEQLWLRNLPALTDVCNNHYILDCPLIREVRMSECRRLNKNPLHIRNTDGLLVIEGEEEHQSWRGKVLQEEIQEI